jgi:hypothetical protein
MEPMRIGCISSGLGTPDNYLLVEKNERPLARIDVYDCEGCYAFEDVQFWETYIAVGYGSHFYLVELDSRKVVDFELDGYFGHMYSGDGYLLVASASHLLRILPDGNVLWRSELLGIDGVIVHSVLDTMIEGEGEWDPPGDWKPFRLSLNSGEKI